jgi:tRNA U38,U39,U40 pseudouridine synthase TruA
MARYKLLIEYAGTRYSGWQIQKNAKTIQGELERAIREATGRPAFELYGSGRTDAGVHALGQVAHLSIVLRGRPGRDVDPRDDRAAGDRRKRQPGARADRGLAFIWRMVRRIVGVLAEVGRGSLSTDDVARFLREDSAAPARLTAPASGLFLECVYYADDRRLGPIVPAIAVPAGTTRR